MSPKLLTMLLAALLLLTSASLAESAPVTVMGRPEETISGPGDVYDLAAVHEVDGRQGVAWDNGFFISGSTTLTKYDVDWKLIAAAEEPFSGFTDEVNHFGYIDASNGEIYAGVEYFMDGEAKNIQIAVYDAQTLELTRTWSFAEESGQNEVSGIAVDPDSESVWLCSWADGESGRYLYRYDLETGDYLGKFHLQAPPQWIQGIAYRDGWLYLTADDGTADLGEPDHVYRCKVDVSKTAWTVLLERTLDDVTLQGEIEGITFTDSQMLISYNRGSRIVLGMPKGFYDGYDREIHEVFGYAIKSGWKEAWRGVIEHVQEGSFIYPMHDDLAGSDGDGRTGGKDRAGQLSGTGGHLHRGGSAVLLPGRRSVEPEGNCE